MRHKLWLLVLLAGIALSARPAGRCVKRMWQQWSAESTWAACKLQPMSGKSGEPFAWLHIPDCNLSQMVLRGTDKERLYQFPCHEKVGVADLIMAHRDIHFMHLEAIAEGVPVELTLRGGEAKKYTCSDVHIIKKEEAVPFIDRYAGTECLILLTCYPFKYIGPAPERFIVIAQKNER